MKAFLYLIPYLLSTFISLGVGVVAWRRSLKGSRLFACVAFSEAVWTASYVLQLLDPVVEARLFWNNVQFLGAVAAPLAYLGFAEEYNQVTDQESKGFTWRFLFPAAVLLLGFIWTDGLHGLFRGPVAVVPGQPFDRLAFPNGPGFVAYTVYAYGLLVITTLIFLSRFYSSTQLYRSQIGIVLAGVLIPWVISLLSYFSIIPFALHDATPATFGVCNLIIAWALYRYRLLDLAPVARDFLVENMPEGVLVFDQSLRLVDLNPAACGILGTEKGAVIGRSVERLPCLKSSWFRGLGEGESHRVEVTVPREETSATYDLQISYLQGSGCGVILAVLRDICERKKFEEQLHYLAATDSLTGVCNRRQALELAGGEIDRACRTGSSLSVILLDVDNLKPVNDTSGHRMGDRVLEEVASQCKADLRSQDVFGRYGGDEFIAVLPDTTSEAALHVAERLRQHIEATSIQGASGEVNVTISIGITIARPDTNSSLDLLLEQADRALYQAKAAGRNRVVQY